MKSKNKITLIEQASNGRQLSIWERGLYIKNSFGQMTTGTTDTSVGFMTWGSGVSFNKEELTVLIEFLQDKLDNFPTK